MSIDLQKMPKLGFGLMRLPQKDGAVDIEHLNRMVDAYMEAGLNYFDTAYVYHDGNSEKAIKEALVKRYPRDRFMLATKLPAWCLKTPEDRDRIFNEQRERCGVDYFDFYLLHNICENSLTHYYGQKIDECLAYFKEQKAKGRIRHLGFSSHATADTLARFLDQYGEQFEFCQIQLNYVDWKLQNAQKKVELLRAHGIPVWVMEPVRGGKLAKYAPEIEEKMRALRPEESTPAWAFRWLRTVPRPTMILSGMSNLAQMEDNLKTFSEDKPLNEEELAVLDEAAASLARMIPCTACRYCCAGCPMGLDIPRFI